MLQLGGDADLAQESLGADGRRDVGIQHLDGHLALVAAVPRQVHVRHAAPAQLPLDDVAVAEGLLEWSRRSVTRAGDQPSVSTPVAPGTEPRPELARERVGPGTLLRSRTRYSSTAVPPVSRSERGEPPRLDLRGEHGLDARPRAFGIGRLDPQHGIERPGLLRWLAHARGAAPPRRRRARCGQRLSCSGAMDLRISRSSWATNALVRLASARERSSRRAARGPSSCRRRAAEVGVPEDQDDEVEDDRHHRRGGHRPARRPPGPPPMARKM